ncbi:MAG TPA: Trk system potassium transporter TrkA [Methanotrichaceae archaeon]|nr:Trk system potassium transporter TrkA [Methanotrichaceae archaeon]
MKILIAGAGEMGYLVASELYEDNDVVVVDKDPAACARLEEMDIKVFQGNAANARLLVEAGIKDTEIVLAVTGNDEVNVLVCIIASHFNVKQTIARVSNPEYTDRPVQDRKEIGISYMICPELVMAEELARTLYFPSMLMNRELAEGQVELIEFKVTGSMPLRGPVGEAILPNGCRIVAINRAGDIIIPRKEDDIWPNDHLMLICDSRRLSDLRRTLHEDADTHKIMIVGGGMVGFYLARRLEKMGYEVKLIEVNEERSNEIAEMLSHTMVLNGDGTDISLLKEENVGDMDVLFAVTGLDEKNLLCSMLAKQLGAKKILARVNRNAYIRLFEMVGVDRAVSPGQVTADAVLKRVIGGEEVITLSDERVELVDFAATENSRIIGKDINRELPPNAVAGLVLRKGNVVAADDGIKIQPGDRVFIMAMHPDISKVKELFAS